MVDLITINTKVGLGKLRYLELLEERRLILLEGSVNCGCGSDLDCLRMTIQSLEYDIVANVNNDLTQTVYALLLTLLGDYEGSYDVNPNVSGSIGTPIILNGESGEDGEDGLSAYQIAVNNGFEGTEAEWLASLVGERGPIGLDGQIIVAGDAANILSGHVPPTTEGVDDDWYIDVEESILYGPKTGGVWPNDGIILNGLNGKSAYQIAVDNGFVGDVTAWLESLIGEQGIQGLSAYVVAVNNGFVGTQAEWLASLNGTDGEDGADGLSAYQIALNNGFVGTEAAWLASLQGEDGTGGDFEELNRDVAFTLTDAADNPIGYLTSNEVDTLKVKFASGAEAVSFQEEEYTEINVPDPVDLDIAYALTTNSYNTTLAFRSGSGVLLADYTTTDSGVIGEDVGEVKPKSGELMSITLSTDGTWADPVQLTLRITKDSVTYDSFTQQYETAPTGILVAKNIQPDELSTWEVFVEFVEYVIPEEEMPNRAPVNVVNINMTGGTDTITAGQSSWIFEGDQSSDPDGDTLTHEWIILGTGITITAP